MILAKMSVVTDNFASIKEVLDVIKENVTYAQLVAALGTRDPFFG